MRYITLFKKMSLLTMLVLAAAGVQAQSTKAPLVEFTKNFTDTVYMVGPYDFEAKVASRSGAAIIRPWFHYTATLD